MNRGLDRSLVAAAAACALALFVCAAALVGALRVDTPAAAPAAAPTAGSVAAAVQGLEPEALALAADNDPFQPDRQRIAQRYRLPGDVDPEPEPPPPAPPPVPDFRLSGTALSATASAALIQVGDAQPRMIEIGDYVLGYRLENVTPTSATLAGSTGTLTLNMPMPPQQVVAESQPAAAQRARGNARNDAVRNRARVEQILQRARESGAPPQALEALMRMIEQRGIDAIGEIDFGPNGSMMIRRGRTATPDTTGMPLPR